MKPEGASPPAVQLARTAYPKLPTPMVKGILEIVKHGDIDALKLEIEQ